MKNTKIQSAAKLTEKEIPIYVSGDLRDPENLGKDEILMLLIEGLGFVKKYNQDTGALNRLRLEYEGRDIMYIHVDPEEEYGYLSLFSACINNNEEMTLILRTLLSLQEHGVYINID